jgi:hypothetical protein
MNFRIIIFIFYVINTNSIDAQYQGGSGEGGAKALFRGAINGPQIATNLVFSNPSLVAVPNVSFTVEVQLRDVLGNVAAFSSLGNGSMALSIFNNPASGTLSGTTPVNAVEGIATFSGMSIDNGGFGYTFEATISPLSAVSPGFDVFCMYCSSSGDGGARESGPATTLSGETVWVGGTNTDWNTAANWRPNTAVPGPTDRLAIEANGNGNNPVLDQNRTILSMNFNGSGKQVELGNYTLTLTGNATAVNSTNYFKTNGTGKLRRLSIPPNEGFTFPVGNSAYNPVVITNRTLNPDTFAVRVMDEVYEFGTFGNVLSSPRVKRTWDIDKGTPNSNSGNGVDFNFNWNAGEVSSTVPSTFALFHHDADGNGWAEVVSGQIDPFFSPAANSMIWTGYTGSFSPFGIGDPADPLPVDLLSFTGECSPQGLDFNWATASEVNSKSFVLEHSSNLSDWQALHTQAAAGFSSSQKTYTAQLPADKNYGPYFRLHQQDFDGKFENFPPLHLECSENTGSGLLLYPNPSQGQVQVSGFSGTLDWQIIDASGRQLRSGRLNSEGGPAALSTDGLPAGLYIFQTTTGRLPLMIKE